MMSLALIRVCVCLGGFNVPPLWQPVIRTVPPRTLYEAAVSQFSGVSFRRPSLNEFFL